MTAEGDVATLNVPAAAPVIPTGPLTAEQVQEVLKIVLDYARKKDILVRGLKESIKALDSKASNNKEESICVLAESHDVAESKELIETLCKERGVNLIKVADAKELGEMVGLCKYDREGNPRKITGCSVCVITHFKEKTEAVQALLRHFENVA